MITPEVNQQPLAVETAVEKLFEIGGLEAELTEQFINMGPEGRVEFARELASRDKELELNSPESAAITGLLKRISSVDSSDPSSKRSETYLLSIFWEQRGE